MELCLGLHIILNSYTFPKLRIVSGKKEKKIMKLNVLREKQVTWNNEIFFKSSVDVITILTLIIITTKMRTLWRCNSTQTEKAKLLWKTSHYIGQLLYGVSQKYHFTFSFDSALRK